MSKDRRTNGPVSPTFGVLGLTAAWDETGKPLPLKGPLHRAVLARLLAARGRMVPINVLIDDLWDVPPAGAVSAIRTFVAALRRTIEPNRPPRAAATILVTEGPGYAIRTASDAVDAWRFERLVAEATDAVPVLARTHLDQALALWRGPAYAEFTEMGWARSERMRLEELRRLAVERRAKALLDLDLAPDAVPDLDAHVSEHPWREEGWRLLALSLYRSGRQGDSLAVLRRARALLVDELGIDPSPALSSLETAVLQHDPTLDVSRRTPEAEQVFIAAATAYDSAVGAGASARLESTVGLLRSLAVSGGQGLTAARDQRLATIRAAENTGDPELAARVIGSFDVPGVWARSDDPDLAALVVEAAHRALAGLPAGHDSVRARLLATIAMESRGVRDKRAQQAAVEAERLARELADPALLTYALGGVFMQSFHRTGLAPARAAVGREILAVAQRHSLVNFEIFGHLIRMQALGGLGQFAEADRHATAVEDLGGRHERPLVTPFVTWYRAMRDSALGAPADVAERGYRNAAGSLDGSGMPGVDRGVLPLSVLCLRIWRCKRIAFDADTDWGPYEPWAQPLLLLADGRTDEAAAAVRALPDPPADHMLEALWVLISAAALAVDDRATMQRCLDSLTPAAGQVAGAGSGLLTIGPVSDWLDKLTAAVGRPENTR